PSALPRGEGIDRSRGRLADGRRRRCGRVCGGPRPLHPRRDDARRAVGGCLGQPRGRRPREVRRAAGGPEMTDGDRATIAAMQIEERSAFATIDEAIEDIRQGKFVVVVDAADRENEGDLTIAAQFATPEAVNFMTKEGRGLICLCLSESRCDELGLRQMTDRNETPFGTAFTVSVEAREGVTTGISAPDRSRTI